MKLLITLACVLATVAVAAAGKEDIQLQKLRDIESLANLNGSVSRSLAAYRYYNCGDPNNEILKLTTLTFGPDPLRFPGTLEVEFSGGLTASVHAPLTAVVRMERKFQAFNLWATIPCNNNVGSCTYNDLCAMLSGVSCPAPFISAHIPCHCPFGQGSFRLPKISFHVGASTFPPGEYRATINLINNAQTVACIGLYATLAA